MPYRQPRRLYGIIVGAATLAIMLSFVIAAKSTLDRRDLARRKTTILHQADLRTCQRINKLDTLIQRQLRQSLTTVPELTYYKYHPDELRTVLDSTRKEIEAFAPTNCKETP